MLNNSVLFNDINNSIAKSILSISLESSNFLIFEKVFLSSEVRFLVDVLIDRFFF